MNSVRTCLGCRKRADRSLLVRVVAREGEAVADVSATAPGRGAWVHPTTRCVETAIARKAIARALRADGALGTARLLTAVMAKHTYDPVGVSSETP